MFGPIAQLVQKGEWEEKKHTIAFVDHTPTSKNGVINSSHDPCWRTPEDKKSEGLPSGGSSKYAVKPQVWLAVSYDAKILYIHAKRRRKKRHGPTIKPEYRLELKGVNSTELAYVVNEKFGQLLQESGVTTVIVDNDRKAHSKMVRDAWAKFGIKVWPGAGIVGDRTLISEFTGEDEEKLGGFPVNSPDCMVNDQSVNNTWKNLIGGLYDTFNKRKPSRQTNGGFINDINSSFENLSQEKIQNAIDLQPKIMQAIIKANGGHTNYMSCGSVS